MQTIERIQKIVPERIEEQIGCIPVPSIVEKTVPGALDPGVLDGFQQALVSICETDLFTPAAAVTCTAPGPVIKHVSFAPDDPARIDCMAPAHVIESIGSIAVLETVASHVVGSPARLDAFATPVHPQF